MIYDPNWRGENAPKGLAICPNCRMRERADARTWDTEGGDFWYCTARPVIPVFAGCYVAGNMHGHIGQPINLALFDPASPQAESRYARSCPLFEQREP